MVYEPVTVKRKEKSFCFYMGTYHYYDAYEIGDIIGIRECKKRIM